MSNAIESWSFPGQEGRRADVEVYARAAKVALFINGREVGSKKLTNSCIARFRCTYESGRIEAVAYDGMGREIGRRALQSAGEETVLYARPEEETVACGHLSYVRLSYGDQAGITKPMMRGTIKVQVSGGTLVGLGHACPYNERGYLSDETDTYYGEAMAIIRAGDSEFVSLKASDGTYSTEVRIPVVSGNPAWAGTPTVSGEEAAV